MTSVTMMGVTGTRLPKLAPDTIRRERISAWLSDHADFPLRLIAAPSGSGKTTALVTYAANPRHRAAYVALHGTTDGPALVAEIARAVGVARTTDADVLLELLAEVGRCEILLDEADRTTREARETLRTLVVEAPENVTFAFASRTRDLIDSTRLISLGLAAQLGADRLAFTVEEAARFVEATRATVGDDREIARLVADTDGWAFALCSAVRDAASAGNPIEFAFESWRRSSSRLIKRFVDEALADEDPALADAARRVFDGAAVSEPTLDLLEHRGLFVRWTEGSFVPYRAIARLTRAAAPQPTSVLPPFAVTLFGPPEARVDGQRVEWIRRRDAHLFAFIAMQPNGRASRRAIVDAFWPNVDRQLASQSLRSACSTLRRALAAVVGYGPLSHYVSFGDEIALNLDLFTIDARRVRAHVTDADAAWLRADAEVAREHAEAVGRLTRLAFLNDDVPPALAGTAESLRDGVTRAAHYAAHHADFVTA